MSPNKIRFFSLAFIACSLALLFYAGCANPPKNSPLSTAAPSVATPETPNAAVASAKYLGNEACASCHAGEFKAHKISGHNLTLQFLEDKSSAAVSPQLGRIPGTGYNLSKAAGKLIMNSMSRPDIKGELNFAMGSGNTGITYLHIGATSVSEAQMSYFPNVHKWYRTPGHREKPDTSLGQTYKGAFAAKCVFCHSTHMESDTFVPQKKFFGVGCESCHGAGSAHVAAMKAGNFAEGKMVKLEKASATEVMNVCQQCHIDQSAGLGTSRQVMAGIKQSQCYLQSSDTLSCISCHDPHANVNRDLKSYVSVCIKCHSTPAKAIFSGGKIVQGKICPVNKKTDCVRCHMPRTLAFSDSPTPSKFADHFIRVHKELKR